MRNHSLILTRLVNVPLFLDEAKALIITENVSVRLALGQNLDSGVDSPTEKDIPEVSDKIGIIKVFDSLVSKGGAGESGFTSYEGIKNKIDNYISNGVKKIGFYIDSPGGEALGMEGLVNLIQSLPSKGIETFAFTDGMATSAAYGIASATQKIYSNVTAKTGSIGTIMTLMDLTKRDEQQGIKYTILRSKDDKALYNPHEEISKQVLEKAKAELALLDKNFNELINRNRPNLSIEKIISLKGNAFYGEEALSLGLVDKLVSSFDEVLSSESISSNKRKGMTYMNEEELMKQNAELKAKLAEMQVKADTERKTTLSEERERVSKLTQAANTLKIPSERLTKAIQSGISYEEGLAAFETFAEISGINTNIDTSGANSSKPPENDKKDKEANNPFAFVGAMDEAIKLGLLG